MSFVNFLKQKPAILLLEDGREFEGFSLGAEGETSGEICFNTGMSGYQEIITDPSYSGQLVAMTYPHIGNYGTNNQDVESSKIQVSGFIIKEETVIPSNFRSNASLRSYLKEVGVVGIQGIDTRALTIHLRKEGLMNGIISTIDFNKSSLMEKVKKVPQMNGLDLVKNVSTDKKYFYASKNNSKNNKIVAIDFGIKSNILRLLSHYECDIEIVPANTNAEEILNLNPDGIFLSNGPGDPSAIDYGIKTIKKLIGKKPIFGICLGHQLLALALGAKTYKLKFGHHGINHPVKNLNKNTIEITSQNHGFAVDPDSLPNDTKITHINLNDNTVEGFESNSCKAFCVQYHPESGPGPHDSRYLFKKFKNLMKNA
tara:strand:+ start:28732 stop:29841 length:1110 start_codon:yes stop_codon:yes gene_type:complete